MRWCSKKRVRDSRIVLVLLFFHDGRVSQMPAIIASVPQEIVEKLLFPEKTALDSNRG